MIILGGLVLIGLGTLMVIYTEWLLRNFGRIDWFERKLGAEGGSRLGYKLLGIIIIFFGLMMVTGIIGGFMGAVTAPLVNTQL